MCGIAGYWQTSNQLNRDDLQRMTDSLEHRGPDADGLFVAENAGLGHRRLSILDLSSAANQPMPSRNGQFMMAYNGEVYNFQEIAKELDIEWKTTGDTEVILEAFAKWGISFVERLNGMFAIAIYDQNTHELFLFRDRIGIKPLYYYWDGELLAFGSELKAIKTIKGKLDGLELDHTAISAFLHLGYIPQPKSIYKNVFKLKRGFMLKVSKAGLFEQAYWSPDDQLTDTTVTDETEAKAKLDELLTAAVQKRMISDVPIGTFLSGGIDSSTVTALAQKISSEPVKTFSIGFEEQKYNEAGYAAEVAKHLGTDHHELILSEQSALDLFESVLPSYDEPYADTSAVPTMLVSEFARQHVTVALSGDGGDEQFMGYGAYNWALRLSDPIVRLLSEPIGAGLSMLGDRFKRAGSLFKYDDYKHIKSHIFSQEQYLHSHRELDQLMNEHTPMELEERYEHLQRRLSVQEQQAYFDLNYYLPDDLLVKVDRASMKYSLEVRVPLLDHEVVQFSLNLDQSLKKNINDKHLLREVLYQYAPKKMFERPKWGFSIPLLKWMKGQLKPWLTDYLSKDVVERFGIVNYNGVAKLLKEFDTGADRYYNRIWALVLLHKWLMDNE